MENSPKSKWFVTELLKGYPDADNKVEESLSDEFILGIACYPSDRLIVILASLSRFLCHVQFFGNQKHAEVVRLKRKLESRKSVAMSKLTGLTDRTTSTQIAAKIYSIDKDISVLEDELADSEEKARYYDKMPDRINEHIQVIKYELKRREQGRG